MTTGKTIALTRWIFVMLTLEIYYNLKIWLKSRVHILIQLEEAATCGRPQKASPPGAIMSVTCGPGLRPSGAVTAEPGPGAGLCASLS